MELPSCLLTSVYSEWGGRAKKTGHCSRCISITLSLIHWSCFSNTAHNRVISIAQVSHQRFTHTALHMANLQSKMSVYQPIPMHIPSQMQDFAFVFAELQQVLRPAVPNSPNMQHHPPAHLPLAQFGVIHQFAECTSLLSVLYAQQKQAQ